MAARATARPLLPIKPAPTARPRSAAAASQLAAGAAQARFPWLLFLHADTALEQGWEREALAFHGAGRHAASAAWAPRHSDLPWTIEGVRPRLLERLVALRCTLLRLPYGDQGLLIPKRLYDELGGYRPLPLMEDVDLVRRSGRRRIIMLRSRAITSAERFRRDGYVRRSARNLLVSTLYLLRVPTALISRIYG